MNLHKICYKNFDSHWMVHVSHLSKICNCSSFLRRYCPYKAKILHEINVPGTSVIWTFLYKYWFQFWVHLEEMNFCSFVGTFHLKADLIRVFVSDNWPIYANSFLFEWLKFVTRIKRFFGLKPKYAKSRRETFIIIPNLSKIILFKFSFTIFFSMWNLFYFHSNKIQWSFTGFLKKMFLICCYN